MGGPFLTESGDPVRELVSSESLGVCWAPKDAIEPLGCIGRVGGPAGGVQERWFGPLGFAPGPANGPEGLEDEGWPGVVAGLLSSSGGEGENLAEVNGAYPPEGAGETEFEGGELFPRGSTTPLRLGSFGFCMGALYCPGWCMLP